MCLAIMYFVTTITIKYYNKILNKGICCVITCMLLLQSQHDTKDQDLKNLFI